MNMSETVMLGNQAEVTSKKAVESIEANGYSKDLLQALDHFINYIKSGKENNEKTLLEEAMEPYEKQPIKLMNDFHKALIDDPDIKEKLKTILESLSIPPQEQEALLAKKVTVHAFLRDLSVELHKDLKHHQVDQILAVIGKPMSLYLKEHWKKGVVVVAVATISLSGLYFGIDAVQHLLNDHFGMIKRVLTVSGGAAWAGYQVHTNRRFTELTRTVNLAVIAAQLISNGLPIAFRIAGALTGSLTLGIFAVLASSLELVKHAAFYRQLQGYANKRVERGREANETPGNETPGASEVSVERNLEIQRDMNKDVYRQAAGWERTKGTVLRSVLLTASLIGVTSLTSFAIIAGTPGLVLTVTLTIMHMLFERIAAKKDTAALSKDLQNCDKVYDEELAKVRNAQKLEATTSQAQAPAQKFKYLKIETGNLDKKNEGPLTPSTAESDGSDVKSPRGVEEDESPVHFISTPSGTFFSAKRGMKKVRESAKHGADNEGHEATSQQEAEVYRNTNGIRSN